MDRTHASDAAMVQKLGQLFSKRPLPEYAAVAFDWVPEPSDPRHVRLTISTAIIPDGSLEKFNYLVVFAESDGTADAKGVTETVGLMPKTSLFYDEIRSEVFERDLADLLHCELCHLFEAGHQLVVLQGPLFPKLVGRIGYRHLKRDFTLAAICFRRQWFPRISFDSVLLEVH